MCWACKRRAGVLISMEVYESWVAGRTHKAQALGRSQPGLFMSGPASLDGGQNLCAEPEGCLQLPQVLTENSAGVSRQLSKGVKEHKAPPRKVTWADGSLMVFQSHLEACHLCPYRLLDYRLPLVPGMSNLFNLFWSRQPRSHAGKAKSVASALE